MIVPVCSWHRKHRQLYKQNNISPFGSILVMFIQLPILMGMYYATMRASAIVVGSFGSIDLSITPLARTSEWTYFLYHYLCIDGHSLTSFLIRSRSGCRNTKRRKITLKRKNMHSRKTMAV